MNYKKIIKIQFIGFGILLGAILINIIANLIGLSSWYTLINNIVQLGFIDTIKQTNIISIIFLIIIYPFLLGLIGYKLIKK